MRYLKRVIKAGLDGSYFVLVDTDVIPTNYWVNSADTYIFNKQCESYKSKDCVAVVADWYSNNKDRGVKKLQVNFLLSESVFNDYTNILSYNSDRVSKYLASVEYAVETIKKLEPCLLEVGNITQIPELIRNSIFETYNHLKSIIEPKILFENETYISVMI